MPKLMRPIHCREKWLVIAAIRFLRTCISMKDEFYYRWGTYCCCRVAMTSQRAPCLV